MVKTKKLYFMKENNLFDMETGEIFSKEEYKEWLIPKEEPDYIKLYLDTVLTFNELPKTLSPLLIELLKYMTYANNEKGGQIIILNSYIRADICKKLDLKPNTLVRNLTTLCGSSILQKIALNTYQVNPFIFGKGDWASVKAIRATFNFNAGTIISEILENE